MGSEKRVRRLVMRCPKCDEVWYEPYVSRADAVFTCPNCERRTDRKSIEQQITIDNSPSPNPPEKASEPPNTTDTPREGQTIDSTPQSGGNQPISEPPETPISPPRYTIRTGEPMIDHGAGGLRSDDSEKSRPDLISPYMLERLGHWIGLGAKKYGLRNWEKGISAGRCLAGAFRHLLQYMKGKTDEDHLSAVLFNVMVIIHFEELARLGDPVAGDMLDLPWYEDFESYPDIAKLKAPVGMEYWKRVAEEFSRTDEARGVKR